MRYTRLLSELTSGDILTAGGKAASLGKLINAGIQVPGGFVLLTEAFDLSLKQNGADDKITTILQSLYASNIEEIENASRKIKELVTKLTLDIGIENEIHDSVAALGENFVAVRSSATVEDGENNAWAGQFDSFLNTTSGQVLINIKNCWASLFSPHALSYRLQKERRDAYISMAVVVQAMVQSEVSGIAFSVHPVTHDHTQLIIEAGYGLGEAIVSGKVTPDSYIIGKDPLKIIDKKISAQTQMLNRSDAGNNSWNRLNALEAVSQKLADDKIIELSGLVSKIEGSFGCPCDIEWALHEDSFFITQSRPITTLQEPSDKNKNTPAAYEKLFSRDFCLASVEAWVKGESINPKEWTDLTQPFLPYIVTERSDDTVHFWYDLQGVDWIQDLLVKLSREEPDFLLKIEKGVLEKLEYIRPIYEQRRILTLPELKKFLKELEGGYPWFEAMWWFCQMNPEKLTGIDVSSMGKTRELTDILCNASDTVIRQSLNDVYPALGNLSESLTIEEISTGALPDMEILSQRDQGYYYACGKLFPSEDQSIIEKHYNISLSRQRIPDNLEKVSGSAAMKGVVRGFVRRVMGHKQIGEVKDGEILVTPMTIPDFLPAIKKAAAIITDEGGIISHAAITARELNKPAIVGTTVATSVLKNGDLVEVNGNHALIIARELSKPCIVGTRIATHVLKDGDLVEVDADHGIVRVLKPAT